MSTGTIKLIVLLVAATALAAAIVATVILYRGDLARTEERIRSMQPWSVDTPFGPMEVLLEGDGPVVLVSHGITGGIDQARGLARSYLGGGYRLVLVSRFGYLGSAMPDAASPKMQADAFAAILTTLGIERAFVAGNSAGGTAALHFAIEHPDRCQGLILLSSNVPGASVSLPPKPAMSAVFGSSFLYWSAVRIASRGMLAMFVPPGVLDGLGREGRQRLADEVMLGALPIHRRTAGVLFDMFTGNISIDADLPYERIETPTLIVHAIDDPSPPIEGARLIARRIPGARLLELTDGGHLLIGHEAEVRQAIRGFIAE